VNNINRHMPAVIQHDALSPVRLIQRAGEVKPYRYPSLSDSSQVAVVRHVNGLWIADNWLAQHLQDAGSAPFLSDEARSHYKAIGIRFEAKVERGPQP